MNWKSQWMRQFSCAYHDKICMMLRGWPCTAYNSYIPAVGTTVQIIFQSHSQTHAYPEAPGLAVMLFIYGLLNHIDRNVDMCTQSVTMDHHNPDQSHYTLVIRIIINSHRSVPRGSCMRGMSILPLAECWSDPQPHLSPEEAINSDLTVSNTIKVLHW
jgi:hypothetical protein